MKAFAAVAFFAWAGGIDASSARMIGMGVMVRSRPFDDESYLAIILTL
jgi:hypothetical protein